MPKRSINYLFILIILMSASARAQQFKWSHGEYNNEYKPASLYLNGLNYEAQHLPDSIKLSVGEPSDVQQIIDKGLDNKVYAVEIITFYRPDIAAIFSKLAKLPNLRYITITESQSASINDKPYQLPANLSMLPNLQGIEFAYTDKLDMVDAFGKLIFLNHLKTLAITGYYHPLPPNLTSLKQVENLSLNTLNIRDMDLSNVSWRSVYLKEGQLTALNKRFVENDDDQKALANLSKIASLQTLDVSLTHLTETSVFKKYKQLDSLKTYVLSKSKDLVKNISTLTNLQGLSLTVIGSNVIISIDDIANLHNLKRLSLYTGTGTGDIPPIQLNALRNFEKLETLSLAFCKVIELPDVFESLPHLKQLFMHGNQLTSLPESLFSLRELEYLDLSFNPLNKLPNRNNYGWINLKTLVLNANKLTTLPGAITSLSRLENFSATNNRLSILPKDWQSLKYLKTVNLADNKLREFPRGLQNNPSLKMLDIRSNNITIMPDIKNDNYSLTSLDITNNLLTQLPLNIGKFHNLEILQGYNLKLENLPESLGNCLNLKELSLSRSITGKTILPAGLKHASNLEFLNLAGCPLIDHESIFEVILASRAKPLNADLSENNITLLPATKNWANANFALLNLSSNKITALPVELADTKFTTGVTLSNNQLKNNYGIIQGSFKTRGDFKVLFEELKLNYTPNVPDSVYALALINRIQGLSNAKDWKGAINYAEKAKQLAPATYKANAPWEIIGLCRFNVKDYKGANKDFDEYINQQENPGLGVRYATNTQLEYKIKADSALNQPAEMAKTYAKFGLLEHYVKALVICKQINDMALFHQLADKALGAYQNQLSWYANEDHYNGHENFMTFKGQYPEDVLVRFATMALIAGQPAKAIEVLNLTPKRGTGTGNAPIKGLLMAAANYLLNTAALEQIKSSLTTAIGTDGPIVIDQYTIIPFTDWLPASNYTVEQQQHLIVLFNIAETPLPIQTSTQNLDGLDAKQRLAILYKRFDAAYDKKQWEAMVNSANEMIRIDSAGYYQHINWELIGVARFRTKDYQGAVNDLARYIKQGNADFWNNVYTARYKVQAHLALGQIQEAAQTYEDLDLRLGAKTNGLQEAAVLYKVAGNKTKFRQLINAALKRSKHDLDSVTVDLDYNRLSYMLDYAELLIIADKRTIAAKMIKNYSAPYTYIRGLLAVKEYLLAAITVLNGEKLPAESKIRITEFMRNQFKFNVWDFTMFNRWMKYAGIGQVNQQELLALQILIDEKPQ